MTTAFAHLETPLDATPLFYVEAPDGDKGLSEIRRVMLFRQLVRLTLPAVSIVGIPNAGKRGQWALNQAKKEGAVWGFPDMMCLAPGGLVAFLEWKDSASKPAQHQVDCLNRLHRNGFPCGVFRRPSTAVLFLQEHGFGRAEYPHAI